MDGGHRFVSGGRDDRAAAKGLPLGVKPEVPEASEYERLVVGPMEVEGLLAER
jgi:hypothetical protein